MIYKPFSRVFAFLLFISVLSHPITATLIQDDRVTQMGSSPVLGRGYSLATNTIQSTCLNNIQLTIPSYDFTYSYQEVDLFLEASQDPSSGKANLINPTFRKYLEKFGQKLSTKKLSSKLKDQKQRRNQIVVSIQVNSYYASIDESRSQLSESAARLIKNMDFISFFSSCGSYYIKSIVRNALFVSVFEFQSIGEKEDNQFVKQLELNMKGLQLDAHQPETYTIDSKEKSFSQLAGERSLTISTAAFGLGTDRTSRLVSHNISTFRAALKDALHAMQNMRTGKVTSIEVIPWVENSNFQHLVKLDFEEKRNLIQNAEFIAEIERIDRRLLNTYYKAKLCQKQIDSNWKQTVGRKRILKPLYANRWVMNNRYNQEGIKLSDLDQLLSDNKVEQLLQRHRQFMFGGKLWGKGANTCTRQLLQDQMLKKNYQELKSCRDLDSTLIAHKDYVVDNHCLPVLYSSGSKPVFLSKPVR
ncbi:MAG: hypothetical protein GY786_03830 [Proteobacteria bacterium]|nr:hypothetical protein [Pseudomonadota bacterium]